MYGTTTMRAAIGKRGERRRAPSGRETNKRTRELRSTEQNER
jgi:hypothetical protein